MSRNLIVLANCFAVFFRDFIAIFICLGFCTITNGQKKFIGIGYQGAGSTMPYLISISATGHGDLLYDFPIVDPTSCTGVIQGPDGKIYGGTSKGGTFHSGTIFSINSNGSGIKVLYNAADTEKINAPPVLAPDGYLYFFLANRLARVKTDGTNFSVVAKLAFTQVNYRPLITSQGWLFNYAYQKDTAVIFKMKTNGDSLEIIHSFPSTAIFVDRTLCLTPGGRLYGTTNDFKNYLTPLYGVFFSIKPDGTDFTIHKSFTDLSEGGYMMAYGAVSYDNGKVFFCSQYGGTDFANRFGRIFSFDTLSKTISVLYNFTSSDYTPRSELVARNNVIIGLSYSGFYKLQQDGTGFEAINTPWDQYYYAVTKNADSLFFLTNDNIKTIAFSNHSISAFSKLANNPNGHSPACLTKLSSASLAGINLQGGLYGGGTIFRINNDGSGYKILCNLNYTNAKDHGNLLKSNGTFFGVVGNSSNATIFSLDTSGSNYHVIYNISSLGNVGKITLGPDGFLYGITQYAIYKVDTSGNNYQVLKQFSGATDGSNLQSSLVFYNDYLYGVCASGGLNGLGTFFQIGKGGTGFKVLHHFSGADGANPASIMMASDNNFYGTTFYGGQYQRGTLFQYTTFGLVFKTLYHCTANDKYPAYSNPVQSSNENSLYLNTPDEVLAVTMVGERRGAFTARGFTFKPDADIFELNDNGINCSGGNTSITSTITGNNYSYQWQVNKGMGFSDITNDALYSGVTTATLSLANIPYSINNYEYRCAVNNGNTVNYSVKRKIELQSGWSGSVSDDWFNPLNWYCGQVPDNKAIVVICTGLSNYPVIKQDINCESLKIQNGASLTVANGARVLVSGVNL